MPQSRKSASRPTRLIAVEGPVHATLFLIGLAGLLPVPWTPG